MPFDWKRIMKRYGENPSSSTKTGQEFPILRVTETAIIIGLPSGEEHISRKNLETAVRLIEEGTRIEGPADYRRLVYDQRPAYAWAILRDMGYV